MGVIFLCFAHRTTTIAVAVLCTHHTIEVMIQIELEGFADVIMHLHLRIEGGKFLTLCGHAENTTDDHSASSIDFCISSEYLWEPFGHAASDAMMLTLTYSRKVAQTTDCRRIEAFEVG